MRRGDIDRRVELSVTTVAARARNTGAVAVFAVACMCLSATSAAAQALEQQAFSGATGASVRDTGRAGDCCGPFKTDLERSRAIWARGGLSRKVSSRVGLDGELTWSRERDYIAYFQGVVDTASLRAYRAENKVDTVTVAGLVRLRPWHTSRSALDVVSGLGWARERRRSQLESVVFRPGPFPTPTITTHTADTRPLMPVIAGIELMTSGTHLTVGAQIRLHWVAGAPDRVRTDLELGRQIVFMGVGVRRRF